MSRAGSCTASDLCEELGCLLRVIGHHWKVLGIGMSQSNLHFKNIISAVCGEYITMGKKGGSITRWVDTVVIQVRNIGALN